jgi:hypothetical protein
MSDLSDPVCVAQAIIKTVEAKRRTAVPSARPTSTRSRLQKAGNAEGKLRCLGGNVAAPTFRTRSRKRLSDHTAILLIVAGSLGRRGNATLSVSASNRSESNFLKEHTAKQ